MGRRIDVVLVIGPVVFAIEFKVGEKTFDRSAIDQVWDYGLDLKNFHEASHNASIIPILIAPEATECPPIDLHAYLPPRIVSRSRHAAASAVLAEEATMHESTLSCSDL